MRWIKRRIRRRCGLKGERSETRIMIKTLKDCETVEKIWREVCFSLLNCKESRKRYQLYQLAIGTFLYPLYFPYFTLTISK